MEGDIPVYLKNREISITGDNINTLDFADAFVGSLLPLGYNAQEIKDALQRELLNPQTDETK